MSSRLLPALALVCVLGVVSTVVIALHTGRGLHDDAALFHRVYGNGELPVRATGVARTLLLGIDAVFVMLATLMLVGLAAVQGLGSRALAAAAIVVCSVGSVEALKHGLPHIDSAIPGGRPPTIPSGHTSVAVSLGLALVLAAPPFLRPAAALVGAGYAAGVGLSVILLGWHYPADVVAAFFVCGFWGAAIVGLIGGTVARPQISAIGALVAVAVAAAALALAALIASRHPVGVTALRSARSVVATGAALGVLSLALFGAFTPLVGERRQ
jgi:membrane-associated phospholipid phosphatase